MSKLKVYYAHSMHLYGKPQEKRDIELLEAMGFEVVNPSGEDFKKMCTAIKEECARLEYTKDQTSDKMMTAFREHVVTCQGLAFRAHPDGKIPSGVGKEILWAREVGNFIFELPTLLNSRFLEIGETRQYLEYLGER